MNTILYYFTGTGNSLKVTKDLARYLENVTLVQIRQERLSEQIFTDAETIGFIVPTIFSGIPRLVGQFIDQLGIMNQSPYIFTISTHGDRNGMGIGREQVEKHLGEKGLSLSAYFAVQMPHNGPEKDHVTTAEEKKLLFNKENGQIPVIAERIRNCQLTSPKTKKFKSIIEHMINNRVNKSANKNPFDKGFYADEKCTGCFTCSKVCPANNIIIVNGKPKWKLENCQSCFACLQWCPKAAIQYKKGTIGIERYHHPEIKANELFK